MSLHVLRMSGCLSLIIALGPACRGGTAEGESGSSESDGSDASSGDGDGDASSGDGDGDTSSGDGDGDSGDGDGDGDPPMLVEPGDPGPGDVTFDIRADTDARPISPLIYGTNGGRRPRRHPARCGPAACRAATA